MARKKRKKKKRTVPKGWTLKQPRVYNPPFTFYKYNFMSIVVFFIAIIVSVNATQLASKFSIYYIAINATTAIMFTLDKILAIVRAERIPERTLHLLEFFGGSLSTFFVQFVLRHKTHKKSFRFISKLNLLFHLIILFFVFKSLIVF